MKKSLRQLILICLFCLVGGYSAHAETRLYKYDGNMPFVKMMLSMMVTMGILDRLPNNGYYGDSRLNSNPMSRWSRQSDLLNGSISAWDNPNWGVLPTNNYADNNYSPYGSTWSADDASGWVNEDWEDSSWNPRVADRSRPVTQTPIVQNFNYNVPQPESVSSSSLKSPQENDVIELSASPEVNPPVNNPPINNLVVADSDKKQTGETEKKLCVTDFCGLKKPSLNGLWLAENGEMLGVNNHRYLWSDSKARYLTGQLKVQNEFLLANIDGHDQLMRFKYKLAGNRLLTQQPSGERREFIRVPRDQYDALYYGYGQNNGNYYYQ